MKKIKSLKNRKVVKNKRGLNKIQKSSNKIHRLSSMNLKVAIRKNL